MSDSSQNQSGEAPVFDPVFRASLARLLAWRRDVRRFRGEPIDRALLQDLLGLATLSPSVGNAQPWRFVDVVACARRQAVIENFESCNAAALASYSPGRADLYARLKLEGLREAPVHLAVFCDEGTAAGHRLGRTTMPETLRYSVVGAIQCFWLAARAHGLGVGWISILDPGQVSRILEVPNDWTFMAYLCVGHPVEEHSDPELVRHDWQERLPLDACLLRR